MLRLLLYYSAIHFESTVANAACQGYSMFFFRNFTKHNASHDMRCTVPAPQQVLMNSHAIQKFSSWPFAIISVLYATLCMNNDCKLR